MRRTEITFPACLPEATISFVIMRAALRGDGRAEECDIRPLSEQVSRRHCVLHFGPAEVWAEDLGSRNGTYVNGGKISERVRVTDGDVIRVGSLELRLSCVDPASQAGDDSDVSRWLSTEDGSADSFDTTQTSAATLDRMPAAEVNPAGKAEQAPAKAEQAPAKTEQAPAKAETAPAKAEPEATKTGPEPGTSDAASPEAAAQETPTSPKAAIEALKAALAQPGTLPRGDKKSATSSREAAAEALKKFFERR
ncbi:MAG: FHA domain-containing protein [Planctomycetia bacterium]|nr:FHA domain-containing protein [Planctomycetia bacterium]